MVAMVVGSWQATEQLGQIQDEGGALYVESRTATAAAGLASRLYQVIADAEINRDMKVSDSEWEKAKKDADGVIAEMSKISRSQEDKQSFYIAKSGYDDLVRSYEKEMLPLLRSTQDITPAIRDADGKLDPFADTMTKKFSEISERKSKEARDKDNYFDGVRSSVSAYSLVAGSVGVVLALLSTMLIGRSIATPLLKLSDVLEKIGRGVYDVTVPGTERKDEIGTIAVVVNGLKNKSSEVDGMRKEQENLQHKADVDKRHAMTQLANTFEASVKNVVTTVSSAAQQLQGTAQSMSSNAEQTNRQCSVVAAAAEEASANVQTVASATEQLSSSINEISRQVSESTRIGASAVEEANRANETVNGLAEAAQKIGAVVQLINNIASQTNLLALNATIEAARAGDAGKGFAVVAGEVKNLANQTAKATDDIQTQVSQMQSVTGTTVEAIKSVTATIQRMSEISTTIASAVEQQGAATREIARNVTEASKGTQGVSSNISGVTQAASETGRGARETLSAATNLGSQAGVLSREVEGFISKIRQA
jgi:methyl-accepting chemotaxis protein